jgi:hypothetical protein
MFRLDAGDAVYFDSVCVAAITAQAKVRVTP